MANITCRVSFEPPIDSHVDLLDIMIRRKSLKGRQKISQAISMSLTGPSRRHIMPGVAEQWSLPWSSLLNV